MGKSSENVEKESASREDESLSLAESTDTVIRKYLNLKGAGKIAKLAAALAPKPEKFDARALIADAMALQTEAESELIRQREVMTTSMSYDTLVEIATRLGVEGYIDMASHSDYCVRSTDPVAGPILRQLWNWEHVTEPEIDFESAFEVENPMDLLTIADTRTSLPRPSQFSGLEEALRYAANARVEDVHYEALVGALVSFLRFYPLWTTVQEWSISVSSLMDRNRKDPVTESKKRNRHPMKTTHKTGDCYTVWVKIAEDAKTFRENFSPLKTAPELVEKNAREAFEDHWNIKFPVLKPSKLAWLAAGFYDFWQKYGNTFQEVSAYIKSNAAEITAKNLKNAPQGSASRERKAWVAETKSFMKFLEGKQMPQDRDERLRLVENFSRHCGKTTERAQRKVKIFFLMLCSYYDKPEEFILQQMKGGLMLDFQNLSAKQKEDAIAKMNPSDALALQKGHVPKCFEIFLALTEGTVRTCLALVKPAFNQG